MELVNVPALRITNSAVFGVQLKLFVSSLSLRRTLIKNRLVVEAGANARKESAKIRNRRMQKKFDGTPRRPRLSAFCSEKQLYAMLVDDQNKKCLFYGSTLQKSIRQDPLVPILKLLNVLGRNLSKPALNST
ncbi:50S ribosomal protein L18, chloroplastic-like [Neltuma alba]|uniref:50S ribosomal protein L18, chloroplastic-like n=1 Tax=Neltuma alba TaxID=207710 RepID=UPI0010A568C8|nr:50S ribosomal protein L18, chloroplastic-like [Prosopis alba]